MESIFRERQSTGSGTGGVKWDDSVKEIKNLTKEFLIDMGDISQAQKINLIYTNLTKKKPSPNLPLTKKLNRILYEQKYGDKIKHTKKFMKKKKKFRFPFKWKKIIKLANKKGNQVLVWYFNRKGTIEPPKLHPLYASDMIIIRNRPHEVDPRAFWRLGKHQCLCIKEIDRRPISNLDYQEIKARGDSTDSDEFIIKASMQAMLSSQKKKVALNKGLLIVLGIVALAVVVFFVSK